MPNGGKKHTETDGFTIVEVLVTLVITVLFLTTFFSLYMSMESQRIATGRRALASNIAYSNLSKVTDRSTVVAAAACDASTSGNVNNLSINSSATGSNITSLITTEPTTGLGNPTTQTVRAFYPRGCAAGMPIKIQATTTFGNPAESVVHATYIK